MTGIIILAAGTSSRFRAAGGEGNKLNVALTQSNSPTLSVFATTLHHALASGLAVHVVTRAENQQVQAECKTANVNFTLIDSQGSGESIAAGVRDTAGWTGWLIHLADMPYVTPQIFRQVAGALQQADTARPYWQATPGHPVGFSQRLRQPLLQLSGDQGARQILQHHPALRITADNTDVIADIDLPSQICSTASNRDSHAAP